MIGFIRRSRQPLTIVCLSLKRHLRRNPLDRNTPHFKEFSITAKRLIHYESPILDYSTGKDIDYDPSMEAMEGLIGAMIQEELTEDIRKEGKIKNVDEELEPLIKNIHAKTKKSRYYQAYQKSLQSFDRDSLLGSGNIQDCFAYLVSKPSEVSSLPPVTRKGYKDMADVESAIALVVDSVLSVVYSSCHEERRSSVLESIDRYLTYNSQVQPLNIPNTKTTREEFAAILNQDGIMELLSNPIIINAIQILKFKLEEVYGWVSNPTSDSEVSISDHEIMCYITSLFEPSIESAVHRLRACHQVPVPICYDILLRAPSNDSEFGALLEIYDRWGAEICAVDQEKTYFMKQFDSIKNPYKKREHVVPPAFMSLFNYACRNQPESLPSLVETFLSNTQSENILEQIDELIWSLSIDQTGEPESKPNLHYKRAQSKLINAVNNISNENKKISVSISAILGVCNLTYQENPKKAFQLFKAAQFKFDKWQLESFNIDGFEKVLTAYSAANEPSNNVDELRRLRKDLSVKLLCSSILLLPATKSNAGKIIFKLFKILEESEKEALVNFSDIWLFVAVKLNAHSLLNKRNSIRLWELYKKTFHSLDMDPYYNPLLIDLLLNNLSYTDKVIDIVECLGLDNLDDVSLSRLVSRLYSQSLLFRPNEVFGPAREGNLIDKFSLVSKLVRQNSYSGPLESKIDYPGCSTPYDLARLISQKREKASSVKIQSSYLLGEALLSPENAFIRYHEVPSKIQHTHVALSSLFVALLKSKENGSPSLMWNGEPAIDLALQLFDRRVEHGYGDSTEGLLYPSNALIGVYIKALGEYGKYSELINLLPRLVQLRFKLNVHLFKIYLNYLIPKDANELLNGLSTYERQMVSLKDAETEYELIQKKENFKRIPTDGRFGMFFKDLECNWDVVRTWEWP